MMFGWNAALTEEAYIADRTIWTLARGVIVIGTRPVRLIAGIVAGSIRRTLSTRKL